jgi:Fe-S-cluster-containing dehydrogenase component
VGHFAQPQCVEVCPVDCIPVGQAETREQLELKYQALMAEKLVKGEAVKGEG